MSAAIGAFRIEAHAPSKATQGISSELQATPIQSFITEIQPFSRRHYLHFLNNWFFAKLGTNSISVALGEFRIEAHASSKATQGLSNDLQMPPIESLITEIQSFCRGHHLNFWNICFFAKLGTKSISDALGEYRVEAHASCRATQGLSNDLQMTPIESVITEIQPFCRGHYLKFWNNWFSAKLWTNAISAAMGAFRIEAHAPSKATQGLSNELQATPIESLITEI